MAHSRTPKLALAALIWSAFTALALSSFAGADEPGSETFAGTCEMSGVIKSSPALTNTPTFMRFHGTFSGVCSGTFTDRDGETQEFDAVRSSYDGRGEGELSCIGGISTGTGKLVFGGGREIDFRLTERRGPGVATVTLEGEAGGSAVVQGTVSQEEDLQELNERCNGSGIRHLRGDARIASPGISG